MRSPEEAIKLAIETEDVEFEFMLPSGTTTCDVLNKHSANGLGISTTKEGRQTVTLHSFGAACHVADRYMDKLLNELDHAYSNIPSWHSDAYCATLNKVRADLVAAIRNDPETYRHI